MKLDSKKISTILVVLVIVNIGLFSLLFFDGSQKTDSMSEISSIPQTSDFNELSTFFEKIAEEKGGRYAFNLLKKANLSPNVDLHLLGHNIGDVLYKQEGIEAITACDNDFRNACSHSVVIGIFSDKGVSALGDISEACKKAPGGVGAYTMCFHGLGHGILSFEGYDMEKASAICQKTGTKEYGYSESAQCISGTVMEIIGGGFHDRDIWEKQRVKYLNKSDPLALCRSDFIPNDSKFFCYDYLTPFLFEAVGADVGNPTSEDFKKAFKFCELIPKSDSQNRDACFGGFGKEFDGLVQGRDIRQGSINSISNDKLKQVHDWCILASDRDGKKSCIIHAMNSLYWGGENDRGVSIRFCGEVTDNEFRSLCFSSLTGAVSYYIKDKKYREEYCGEIPDEYNKQCRETLNI